MYTSEKQKKSENIFHIKFVLFSADYLKLAKFCAKFFFKCTKNSHPFGIPLKFTSWPILSDSSKI